MDILGRYVCGDWMGWGSYSTVEFNIHSFEPWVSTVTVFFILSQFELCCHIVLIPQCQLCCRFSILFYTFIYWLIKFAYHQLSLSNVVHGSSDNSQTTNCVIVIHIPTVIWSVISNKVIQNCLIHWWLSV